jgi:hypothetical protein
MEKYIIHIREITGRIKILPAFIFTLIAIAGFLNTAHAQKNNLSDWNVPPPLPPGNLTKGNIIDNGGPGKPIILILNDIPPMLLPPFSPVELPLLAAISTTPPFVNTPAQPGILDIDKSLPDIPLPAAPDAPPLPNQALQDGPLQPGDNVPVPAAPEMPVLPREPKPSDQTTNIKLPIPLMPGLINPSLILEPGNQIDAWPTPGIQENINFKLVLPVKFKAAKYNRKGLKGKSRPIKN